MSLSSACGEKSSMIFSTSSESWTSAVGRNKRMMRALQCRLFEVANMTAERRGRDKPLCPAALSLGRFHFVEGQDCTSVVEPVLRVFKFFSDVLALAIAITQGEIAKVLAVDHVGGDGPRLASVFGSAWC